MIDEGEQAPAFTLPAVVDGDVRDVSLEDYLEGNVVVLAFYPGDFNPACDGESTGLDELDLFTMQKDVVVLGISGDSVYSHRAFAAEYDLRIPLLSDVRAEVAAAYGVAADDPRYPTRRAVVVLDPDGTVRYTWAADGVGQVPDVDAMREAVTEVGGAATAAARYRVGHAHYVEGRRAFTSAMGEFEKREWMMSQNDFAQAHEEFTEASEQFDTAARFAENEAHRTYYERAERKAGTLGRAAEWLAQSASAFASGEGRKGQTLRDDAEAPLETARDIHEPVPPEEFPPETDPADTGEAPAGPADEGAVDGADDATAGESDARDGPRERAADDGDSIDEAELEEITAELEEQSPDPSDAVSEDDATDPDPAPDAAEVEGEIEGDVELDLTDPTENGEERGDGTDEEGDDENEGEGDESDDAGQTDLGGGDHGVPDSL